MSPRRAVTDALDAFMATLALGLLLALAGWIADMLLAWSTS